MVDTDAVLHRPALALLGPAFVIWVAYLVSLAVYRLYLSPIAKFPGPKLAALSNWYEFYYDVYLGGQFSSRTAEPHKKYGPIVRITPTELHVRDPDFYDHLYSRNQRRDKFEWMSNRFNAASSLFTTANHDLHRARRAPLNSMFSKQRIREFQPVIREKLDKLCQVLEKARESGEPVRISRGYNAFAGDIITRYSFGEDYNHLETPDFETTFHDSFKAGSMTSTQNLQFPWLLPMLSLFPPAMVMKMQPLLTQLLIFQQVGDLEDEGNKKTDERQQDLIKQIKKPTTAFEANEKIDVGHVTIFGELLSSSLPPQEKSIERLAHEAQNILAAGLETTAWALATGTFYIIRNPEVKVKLWEELEEAIPNASTPLDWSQLEKLPYLGACIRESIRMSYAVSTRLPRCSPDETLQYKEWAIPKNTPVSMNQQDISHDEDIFPDSWSFKPERWLNNPTTKNGQRLEH